MEKEKLALQLMAKFMEWENVKAEGSSSPVWTDGQELNYIRDSIIRIKEEMESLNYLPEAYYRETPPKMPCRYMVNGDEIRKKAKETLQVCRENEDYQFIFCHGGLLNEQQKSWICVDGILDSILKLSVFIRTDNLVEMKKYLKPEKYLKEFEVCRKQLEELLTELEELKPPEEPKEPEMKYEQMDLSIYICIGGM